jgi:hypothetical protein
LRDISKWEFTFVKNMDDKGVARHVDILKVQ